MPRTLDQILTGLAALKPEDFDLMRLDANGHEQLRALTDELLLLPQPERSVQAMFEVMERMPESDLGSTGPLVHTLEQMRGHYETELVESVRRRPTQLTLWMVNRILNETDSSSQRRIYMDLLEEATKHPAATEQAQLDARNFIAYQIGAA